MNSFTIARLTEADAEKFRELRLEGLRNHPESFGSSWEEEAFQPLPWFADRLARNATFAGLSGDRLLGTAGLVVMEKAKARHTGMLVGMYVREEARGTGLAAALVASVIEQATGVVEELRLTVGAFNTAAIRLYERAGFTRYGLDRRALKLGDVYYDEALMGLSLSRAGGSSRSDT